MSFKYFTLTNGHLANPNLLWTLWFSCRSSFRRACCVLDQLLSGLLSLNWTERWQAGRRPCVFLSEKLLLPKQWTCWCDNKQWWVKLAEMCVWGGRGCGGGGHHQGATIWLSWNFTWKDHDSDKESRSRGFGFRWQSGFVSGDVGTTGRCGASAAVDVLMDVVTQQGWAGG